MTRPKWIASHTNTHTHPSLAHTTIHTSFISSHNRIQSNIHETTSCMYDDDTTLTFRSLLPYPIESRGDENYILRIMNLQFIDNSAEELETKDALMANEAVKIQQFYNLLTTSIDVIRTFCEKIPGIGEINQSDRELLFQAACLEMFVLRMAFR